MWGGVLVQELLRKRRRRSLLCAAPDVRRFLDEWAGRAMKSQASSASVLEVRRLEYLSDTSGLSCRNGLMNFPAMEFWARSTWGGIGTTQLVPLGCLIIRVQASLLPTGFQWDWRRRRNFIPSDCWYPSPPAASGGLSTPRLLLSGVHGYIERASSIEKSAFIRGELSVSVDCNRVAFDHPHAEATTTGYLYFTDWAPQDDATSPSTPDTYSSRSPFLSAVV